MKIIPYDARYRDDMIFMVLQAKDALRRVPRLNEDLLDVPGNYLDRGDGFWLALDERDRVIGCVGFSRIPGTEEAFLHRLYPGLCKHELAVMLMLRALLKELKCNCLPDLTAIDQSFFWRIVSTNRQRVTL